MPIKPTFYFPYIRFRSTAWVKTAALFHDQLWRVIPEGYDFFDDPEIVELRKSCEFLKVHHPERLETAAIGVRFIEAIHSGTINRVRISEGQLAEVHVSKLSYAVREFLERENLSFPPVREDFFAMPANAAAAYMAFLTNEYARSRSGTIASDEENMLHAVDLIQAEPSAITTNTRDRILAATFKSLRLRNPSEVDVRKIVKFREKYRSERQRLLSEVTRLESEIPPSLSGRDLEALVIEKAHKIQSAVNDVRRAAESIAIGTVSGTSSAVLNLAITGANNAGEAAAKVAGSIGLGLLIGSVVQLRKQRNSPMAYIARWSRLSAVRYGMLNSRHTR